MNIDIPVEKIIDRIPRKMSAGIVFAALIAATIEKMGITGTETWPVAALKISVVLGMAFVAIASIRYHFKLEENGNGATPPDA